MGRLARKIGGGIRTALKYGAGAVALGGAIYLGNKARETGSAVADTIEEIAPIAQNAVGNAQVLGQQAIQGGQAVIGAGLNAQNVAQQQAQQLGVMGNLGLAGENLGEIVSAQKAQKEKLNQVIAPPPKPVGNNKIQGFGGGGGGDAEIELAVKMARCSQKYGKGLRYKRCMKKG